MSPKLPGKERDMTTRHSLSNGAAVRTSRLLLVAAILLAAHGQSLDWKGLPSVYAGAQVLQPDQFKEASDVFSGDILSAFPTLTGRFTSDLERKVFLGSAEADSLRRLLRTRRPGLLATPYVIKLSDMLPKYDVEEQAFVLKLGTENLLGCRLPSDAPYQEVEALKRYLRHTVPYWTPDGRAEEREAANGRAKDIWFDDLPPVSASSFLHAFYRRLKVRIPDADQALTLERKRESVSAWLGFQLTGEVHKSSKGWDEYSTTLWGGTWYSLKAEKPAIFLVDPSGVVLLHRQY